jgi:pimeloyl-ACP methyl ester carboxylesterase
MKKMMFAFGLLISTAGLTSTFAKDYSCAGGVLQECGPLKGAPVGIRVGYVPQAAAIPFRGNIVYFEGLADSIENHGPLFMRLSSEGYRVIAFDYRGQGGSDGSMDDTRIKEIPKLGRLAWDQFAFDKTTFSQRTVLGWSTGGLAGYYAASQGLVDRVVLIAPGIAPKSVVLITEGTLTSAAPYAMKELDPHLQGISPRSPLEVMGFGCDLLNMAASSRGEKLRSPKCHNPLAGSYKVPGLAPWKIPDTFPGLILFSDPKDIYVNSGVAIPIVKENSKFEIEQYTGALHEIDNERNSIRLKAYDDIVSFLKRTDTMKISN